MTPTRSSPPKRVRLLYVEHTPEDVDLAIHALRGGGLQVEFDVVDSPAGLREKLLGNSYDVVLADYRLPEWSGLDAFRLMRQEGHDLPFILVTGTLGDLAAVDCIKEGVADYVLKDHLARLPSTVLRALEDRRLREERARIEQEKAHAEARIRLQAAALEAAANGIVITDVEGTILWVNPAFTRLTQYRSEEAVGKSTRILKSGKQLPAVYEDLWSTILGGRVWHGEMMNRRKDGTVYPEEMTITPVRNAEGLLQYFVAIKQDVSERAKAEKELKESEERHRTLFENAVYGQYQATPEGRFLQVNPALVRMLGCASRSEVLALSLKSDVYRNPADRQKLLDRIRAEGTVQGLEAEWRKKDGTYFLVRLSGRAIFAPSGEIEYNEIIAEDVTERRLLEKQVNTLQKFDAIGRLAGGIAHDFNNVIGAIIGWSELALEELPPEARLRPHLEKIRHQADRAAALTRQLLAFARRQILEPRNVHLNQTVSETMGLLEKVIGKDVEVRTLLAPNLSVTRADPTQLEQVLMNLCLNARDAMPQGGRLLIETQAVVFDDEYCRLHSYARPGRYVLLAVSDTGVGMNAVTIDHIFEPFYSTKEIGKGTGLGLATVYGIIKQHNGFVNVYSEPGRGTTFRVYLPSAEGTPAVEEIISTAQPRGGTETILVAEDHEGVHEIIRATLEKNGYTVLMAMNGEQAVELFQIHGEAIALLILDVVMPRMSGPEAFTRISEMRPELPVIFSTGYSSEITQLSAAVAQGATILQKPYTPTALVRKVREVLDAQKK